MFLEIGKILHWAVCANVQPEPEKNEYTNHLDILNSMYVEYVLRVLYSYMLNKHNILFNKNLFLPINTVFNNLVESFSFIFC